MFLCATITVGSDNMRERIKNILSKAYMDLSIQYERENEVDKMNMVENLEKQGVKVITL